MADQRRPKKNVHFAEKVPKRVTAEGESGAGNHVAELAKNVFSLDVWGYIPHV